MPVLREATSCGACVYKTVGDETFILLVRPFFRKDSWGLPKGHHEAGETLEETALREVFEETGIQIRLETPLTRVYARAKHENKRICIWLAQQVDDVEAHPHDAENIDVRWFNIRELPTIHYYQRPVVEEALFHLRFQTTGVVPPLIMAVFDDVYSFASSLDEWLAIKVLVVRHLPPWGRRLFSRRHELSKKQQTNALERQLGEMWEQRTGRPIRWPTTHEQWQAKRA